MLLKRSDWPRKFPRDVLLIDGNDVWVRGARFAFVIGSISKYLHRIGGVQCDQNTLCCSNYVVVPTRMSSD